MISAVARGQPAPLPNTGRTAPALNVASSADRFSFGRLRAFIGPGYLVAVGYMDPGNWATSLGGGSAFGYSLLSVLLLANLMAMMLQAASARLGVASGLDLAQACRKHFGYRTNLGLWIGCEVAIIACNLAEVLGMACGLNLVFHIPLILGVAITLLDVLIILRLQHNGMRYIEVFIIALVTLIAVSFAMELFWLHPSVNAVAAGFVPTMAILAQPDMLYLAIAIFGATVMPHNLYLHSSIVRGRPHDGTERGITRAIRYVTWDSNIALALALFVNVGILILAAGAFHRPGHTPVTELAEAYRLLAPLLGANAASTVFGCGLIASGLSSSITGTLAGQVVMEGFLKLRVPRATRAFVTRALAIVPALGIAAWFGAYGVGKLLVLSQIILGIQLPFAMIPLLWFTTRKSHLGTHAFGAVAGAVLWSIALFIVLVDGWAVCQVI
jgi:manganese transport protein